MGKIIFQMMISLDGYFEGPEKEIDWHLADGEFNAYATGLLDQVDALIFGRRTYELMASYWPKPGAVRDQGAVASRMNQLPKIVFSRTLDKAEWHNTRLVKHDAEKEMLKIKRDTTGDLALFGSSNLAVSFIKAGLIDEFRIMVNPLVLGNGTPLFRGLDSRLELKHIQTLTLASGLVMMYYEKTK